jgi:hypothetical protein
MKIRILISTLLWTLFFSAYSQVTTVGIIGTSTPNGWDSDTDLIQDTGNPDLWTLEITLQEGEAKFRANDDWAINWGAVDFPSGTGTQDGPNIPVLAGDYAITFNSATGEYSFVDISPIGIIGSATPGGWDEDTNMHRDTLEHGYVVVITLTEGEAKFRKDDDWVVNWGAADFPTGIGVQDGPNIPVSPAGKYRVTLDTMTGAYHFEPVIEFNTIGIIGDAGHGYRPDSGFRKP